jgi:hypothetical protein
MRLTWLVLGVVLAAGAVAFINTDEPPAALPGAPPGTVPGPRGLQRNVAARPAAPSESEAKQEKAATALLEALGRARAEGDAAKTAALETRLRKEAWDAPSARRHAYRQGRDLLEAAGRERGEARILALDKARRLLSRVLYLPEMFDAKGASTDERTKLMDLLQKLNRQVMRYGTEGLPGVTRKYAVEPGIKPVQIVSRERLPMGSNAILLWNLGNLDPMKLRADSTLLLPVEPLSLHVDTQRRRMAVFIGDWFVKEFRVGIGKEDTPTPLGEFRVHSREKNPDWWKPGGKRIPYGDPANELGSAWIALESEEWPTSAGYGIHGTNKPTTVGTRCSNGCVRLENGQATELYDWVRTASNGGQATRVYIR